MQKILLKPGASGKARILLKARGDPLAPPALPFAQDPAVTVQLTNGTVCWEAAYAAPATRNQPGEFRDRAP